MIYNKKFHKIVTTRVSKYDEHLNFWWFYIDIYSEQIDNITEMLKYLDIKSNQIRTFSFVKHTYHYLTYRNCIPTIGFDEHIITFNKFSEIELENLINEMFDLIDVNIDLYKMTEDWVPTKLENYL